MRGQTLLELLVVLTILGIIISIAAPTIGNTTKQNESHTAVKSLQGMLHAARGLAVSSKQHVTLCPLINNVCSNQWSAPLSIFIENRLNGSLDEDESIIKQIHAHSQNGFWLSNIRPSAPFIRFNSQGFSLGSANTLIFCHMSGDNQFSQQLILSRHGRVRHKNYLNSSNRPYSNLNRLRCNN